jgi:type I restriction-modification system DNA methylase subunit
MDENDRLEQLKTLVSNFSANIAEYKNIQYDESNTRTDFIDKFFTLLDWDVANNQAWAESYRDVIREDKVSIDGTLKAPDYSFRIGGARKFFVEAKKPSVNIKEAAEPALQVRRYAYTAGLPLSILTNFEEFAIYDTRIKPDKNDKASVARVDYFTFKEYEQKFDFLYNTFSKNAINKGSFDKYVIENKNKKGTSEVDTELLALVEEWRMELAKNIAKNNPNLSIYNLNTVVQKIIDRIIFLRIAEDRGIEDEKILLTVAMTLNIYEKLNLLFTKANVKYNSGLFAYEEWMEKIKIEDKVLSNIIVNLYYPECPYVFSILPIEILGSIYERFLGSTIHFRTVKGDTHTAIVEEKPEVKKAGGVYYTPQYIVDYIVKNTVGEKIKNKKPEDIAVIKICDPACGSGSFLVGAYQYLLNYHLDYYTQENNIKSSLKNKKIFEAGHNTHKLTIDEKQRILTNNIFGVDIDNQAVEVTKLSLYLKLLENESKESSEQLFKYSDMALLPSLEDNIKCGNSLIGNDFYSQGQLDLSDDDRIKVNCFDWEKDGFPEIFKNGGFDVVIGNPPYRTLQLGKKQESQDECYLDYYQSHYTASFEYKINLFGLFIEKIISAIINDNGYFSFIVPNSLCNTLSFKPIRKFMLDKGSFYIIMDLRYKVFEDAEIGGNAIFLYTKTKEQKNTCILTVNSFEEFFKPVISKVSKKDYLTDHDFNLILNKGASNILQNIYNQNNIVELGSIIKIYQGIITGDNKKFLSNYAKTDKWKPILKGRDINRYSTIFNNTYVYYSPKDLWSNTDEKMFNVPLKIISRQTSDRIIATLDTESYFSLDSTHVLHLLTDCIDIKYFLGIYNSKLLNFLYQNKVQESGRVFAQVKTINLKPLPIKMLDTSNNSEKKLHDDIVILVSKMLDLKQKEAAEPNQQLKTMISRQIDSVDKAIDTAVYQLYNLTDDEIKVVEG